MSTDRDHDAACPWRRLTVMAKADCQFCPVLARARADERAKFVQGDCPACGRKGLFIGDGGYLTCSQGDCPQPDVFDYYADLRAKVKAIQAPPYVNKCDVSAFREALYVVLALFPEEKP